LDGGIHTSANAITIISTVAGIAIGFLTAWWFARSSKRASDAEQARLLKEISTLRSLLASIAESVPNSVIPDVERTLESIRLPDRVAEAVLTSLKSNGSTSALDLLVRASIGALLNERGEVSIPRLFQAVAHRFPDAGPSAISSSLDDLRKAGKVSWLGDDVMKAEVIRVNS
jgi:hypothetical protein